MAAEITLFKSNDSPWGFRLTGGRDFGTPLTVIKVAVNSVAESSGLQVGDILIKINDVDCHSLSHKEAQDLILNSNNQIVFSVLRGSINLPNDVIDRLTPLPLREFKTPEPTAQNRLSQSNDGSAPASAPQPDIEIIPIQDLEPEILEELGLNPLPEDFLEKAKRDPSPMPEVRPQSRMDSAPDILETLEQLGLQEVLQDIERQKNTVFAPVETAPQQSEQSSDIPVAEGNVEISEEAPVAETCPESEPIVISPPASADLTPTDPQESQCTVQPISEEEFAEFMSGKTEVLEVDEGKSALGVDFKKYEPQAEFLKKSQVFRTIEETEKLVTREEKDLKYTTFLLKPKGPRPVPRPRSKVEEPIANLETPPAAPEQPPEPERKGLYEVPTEEEFKALVRVPTPPPQAPKESEPQESNDENTINETNEVKEQLRQEQINLQQQFDIEKQLNPELFSEEKSDIEVQLEEIQKQLEAIQQLPFEIQQHLSLVQEQLNKIVQHRLHEQEHEKDGTPPAPRPSMVEESGLLEGISPSDIGTLPAVEEAPADANEVREPEAPQNEPQPTTEPEEEQGDKKEFRLRTEEQEPILPPPKKETPQKKRPFLGLGPAPRPLILPGGRKWRTPKDAYNDEFIAETLSAQAEIITGSTLGVNFKRYDPKPVNLEHLRDSSVYKLIHDLEDPALPGKGLASRPAVVPALQDYKQKSTPAAI